MIYYNILSDTITYYRIVYCTEPCYIQGVGVDGTQRSGGFRAITGVT